MAETPLWGGVSYRYVSFAGWHNGVVNFILSYFSVRHMTYLIKSRFDN
ncbi:MULTISPECIES: hypothetical protein [Cronobacter]|nr:MULTISPECIES: hypothetical protein [Cronobacter]WRU16744.1 hypothetical protein U9L39_21665 [Cronobacter malonaticus]